MKILLTHSEGRLAGLATALSAQGFTVTHEPLIYTEFLPVEEAGAAAKNLRGVTWLLFSSRTAVQAWAALGLTFGTYKVAVVGQKTAEEVKKSGGTVLLTAEPANAEGLLRTFLACVSPPGRVGLPCGEQALPILSAGLEEAGFTVAKACLYRTVTHPISQIKTDFIVLASPSAVAALPERLGRAQLIALGPSTQQAIKERGWYATEARTPDVRGVVRAVLRVSKLEVH